MNNDTLTSGNSPVWPKERDPDKVFVAMVMTETLRRETSEFWEELRFAEHPKWKFLTSRLSVVGVGMARNLQTELALQSDCSRLFFIDSDMKPTMEHLYHMLDHKQSMVSAMYPKKTIDSLQWVGNFIGTPAGDDGLAEAYDFGGGFASIDLKLVERMAEKYPETAFRCEHTPLKNNTVYDLWSTGVVTDFWKGETYPRFLTEDFYFCWRARQLGEKVWIDTRCQVGHVGSVDFLEAHLKLQQFQKSSIFGVPGCGS